MTNKLEANQNITITSSALSKIFLKCEKKLQKDKFINSGVRYELLSQVFPQNNSFSKMGEEKLINLQIPININPAVLERNRQPKNKMREKLLKLYQ